MVDRTTGGSCAQGDVVYAELSVRYDRIEDLEAMLDDAAIKVARTPREALFLAGKVFVQYRKSGGARTGVLPDFFIGSHAAVSELPLLTRDSVRYRTYFPSLALIAPEKSNLCESLSNYNFNPLEHRHSMRRRR